MEAIFVHVYQIVDDIDRARDHTQKEKSGQCPQERPRLKHFGVENKSRKHSHILGPLLGPHRPEQAAHNGHGATPVYGRGQIEFDYRASWQARQLCFFLDAPGCSE
jgi:hypothetical protein